MTGESEGQIRQTITLLTINGVLAIERLLGADLSVAIDD